ncbi:DUF3052 domain-containing protein [Glycomyces buryatensis]|uniref:DUF3052 domain-containing protein n=1 Tax=Glycomyces buryatensis TaxID=2570927 RepID=A0A4V6T6I0_9ACTN|nr:DUF3052 domain-containing protein [Glycomyces buryatensis]
MLCTGADRRPKKDGGVEVNGPGSPADVAGIVQRLGLDGVEAVMELGFDTDVDATLRSAVVEAVGELLDEDSDEIVDAVLLWCRDEDGDLVDLLLDARDPLADGGTVWLLSPKAGRAGHINPATVQESADLAGLKSTKTLNVSPDWLASRMVVAKR